MHKEASTYTLTAKFVTNSLLIPSFPSSPLHEFIIWKQTFIFTLTWENLFRDSKHLLRKRSSGFISLSFFCYTSVLIIWLRGDFQYLLELFICNWDACEKSQFTYPLEQGVGHIPPVSTAAFGSTPFQSNPLLARPGRSLQQPADDQQLEMQAVTITPCDPAHQTGWIRERNCLQLWIPSSSQCSLPERVKGQRFQLLQHIGGFIMSQAAK